jgi:hypothetical protein
MEGSSERLLEALGVGVVVMAGSMVGESGLSTGGLERDDRSFK